jgi:hypothetical protein
MAIASASRRAFLAGLPVVGLAAGEALAQQATDPQAFVAEVYRAHMPSVTGNARGVVHDPRLRARFFAPDLAAAIAHDLREAERTGEVPALMIDPITASQDPQVLNLAIRTIARDGGTARVEAVFRQHGGMTQVLYILRQGRAGWMIWDMGFDGRPPALRALYRLP